jgi:hypothetical protein
MSQATAAAPDPLLDFLVKAAEAGMEVGLTLHVSGVVVSGLVVSAARYLKEMSALIASAGVAPEFAESLAELAAEMPAEDLELMDEMPAWEFIHLSGARIHTPGSMAANHQPMLWRGRLDHVSGWSLGVTS